MYIHMYMDYLLLCYILINFIKSMLSYIIYHSCYYVLLYDFVLPSNSSNNINQYRRWHFASPRGGGGILYVSQDKKVSF